MKQEDEGGIILKKKLYKSTRDKQLSGVMGGIGELFGIDPTVLRVIYAILIIMTSGIFLLIYIIAAVVMPTDKDLGIDIDGK
jgi:phage shock protein C